MKFVAIRMDYLQFSVRGKVLENLVT